MCMLCDDEKAYAAYMNYLDAMERQGKAPIPTRLWMPCSTSWKPTTRRSAARRSGQRQDAVSVLLQPG
jgi:hypothetical protein